MTNMTEHEPLPTNKIMIDAATGTAASTTTEQLKPPQDPETREVLKEQLRNLMSLLEDNNHDDHKQQDTSHDTMSTRALNLNDKHDDIDLDSTCHCSDSSDFHIGSSDDDDSSRTTKTVAPDDASLHEELDELQHDLDFTAHSLDDLELEFAQDLQALAQGLECAFENFGRLTKHNDDAILSTLQAQHDHLSDSTRSIFKENVKATLRNKRRRQSSSTRTESPVGVEAHLNMTFDNDKQQPQEQLDRDDEEEEEKFQNWFEKFWTAMEKLLTQQAARKQQQQRNPGAQVKHFFMLWRQV